MQIQLGEITADVELKDVKNVHLSVYPPSGHVRIAAPERMTLDNIRAYAVTKLDWIKKQQRKLREQSRESPREFVDRESHYAWGRRCLLRVHDEIGKQFVEIDGANLVLHVRPGSTVKSRCDLLDAWYRDEVRAKVPEIVNRWESKLGVSVQRVFVRRMKTKWGSCNHDAKSIRLNSELAKKPFQYLEYVVVHEMIHLLEPTHNDRFYVLLTDACPKWSHYREELNQLPVRHEDWRY